MTTKRDAILFIILGAICLLASIAYVYDELSFNRITLSIIFFALCGGLLIGMALVYFESSKNQDNIASKTEQILKDIKQVIDKHQ